MPEWFEQITAYTLGATCMAIVLAVILGMLAVALDDWYEPALRIVTVALLPVLIVFEIALFGFVWLGW